MLPRLTVVPQGDAERRAAPAPQLGEPPGGIHHPNPQEVGQGKPSGSLITTLTQCWSLASFKHSYIMQPSAVTNDLPGYVFVVYALVIIVHLCIICNDAISFYAAGIKEHGAIYVIGYTVLQV